MRTRDGFTLVEMMVALAVGLVVLAGAAAMVRQSRSAYDEIDRASRLHEGARTALSHMAGALAHAGHLPRDSRAPPANPMQAITGQAARNPDGSDALTLNLRGAAANAIAMCGFATPGIDIPARSLYAVVPGPPVRLTCNARIANNGGRTEAMVEGIRRMRLDYGVDTDGDGQADRWLSAAAMSAVMWPRVRLVQVSLDMAGPAQDRRFVTTAWLRNNRLTPQDTRP